MTIHLKAVLAAAVLTCAVPADAASFITYTLKGTASFAITRFGVIGATYGAGNYEATYIVPIGVVGLTEATTIESGQYVGSSYLYFGQSYGNSISTASAIGNRLRFAEIGRYNFGGQSFPAQTSIFDVCLSTSTGNAFPTTGTLAVDPSCSSASFYYPDFRSGTTGVLGTITSVTASISDVRPAAFGLINNLQITNLVPEPSTWALMLAGFGMVGYALRRRRAAFAIA